LAAIPYSHDFSKSLPPNTYSPIAAFAMESAFLAPTDEVLRHFQVDHHAGLTDKQVTELRNKHGRNCA
jgi:hypothetical protein